MSFVIDIENAEIKNFIEKIIKTNFEECLRNFVSESKCSIILTDKIYTTINNQSFMFSSSVSSQKENIAFVIRITDHIENDDINCPIILIDYNNPTKTIIDLKNLIFLLKKANVFNHISLTHGIQNDLKELKENLENNCTDLEQVLEEMIMRISLAVEAKDAFTGDHVKRVANYSMIIAESLGMDSKFCRMLYLSSPLHDVGKIAIPDGILLKPCKLTPQEFEVIKQHTIIGKHLLSGSKHEVIQVAEKIALTHHERFDGTGYPLGLKGEDIPLEGRIVAISDVFDALTSKRPYKEAWSIEKALQEIKNSSGSHFDPQIVQAFFKSLHRIVEVKCMFSN
ncbi:MAG: HD domain-containing phosphohydrolase [bacterium]